MVLLTAMAYLDNAWSVATSRARKAGQMLATELLQLGQTSALGHRLVTLCGYSVGALVINFGHAYKSWPKHPTAPARKLWKVCSF